MRKIRLAVALPPVQELTRHLRTRYCAKSQSRMQHVVMRGRDLPRCERWLSIGKRALQLERCTSSCFPSSVTSKPGEKESQRGCLRVAVNRRDHCPEERVGAGLNITPFTD